MKNFISIATGLLFTFFSFGQQAKIDKTISLQDSILLSNFWIDFKYAITQKDKDKLARLCEFPFSCRPCINDTTLKYNDHITIKVTKNLFLQSQYKVFFGKQILAEIAKHEIFHKNIFSLSFDSKNRPTGFLFSYTISPPSTKWEGLQGFIYLNKISGKYKITGIDTVP